MKKTTTVARKAKTGQFTLSSRKGEKISAVEGMKLSPRMGAILKESRERGLSSDEQRRLVKKQISRN
ncbi:hypothetical protein NKI19_24825 [Mesorhizobium sp. M0751]|uniref:hypothetical protein n=1 Tax=unclassified Mesorhizobium TaxID=325217 RepID=UPI00333DABAC